MAEILRLPTPGDGSPSPDLFGARERIADLIPGGEDLTGRSVFGDDEWDLAGHRTWKDKSGAATRLDFSRIGVRWRQTAKDLALLQLNPALAPERAPGRPLADHWPEVQEPIAPVTAQANIKMLGHALGIIDRHNLTRFDTEDWERLSVLLVQPPTCPTSARGPSYHR
jgi:hypothetical protein